MSTERVLSSEPDPESIEDLLERYLKAQTQDDLAAKTASAQAQRRYKGMLLGALSVFVLIGLLVFWMYLSYADANTSGFKPHEMGDAFNLASAAFSGIALAFLIVSMDMQGSQLGIQSQDLRQQKRTLALSVQAQVLATRDQRDHHDFLQDQSRVQRSVNVIRTWVSVEFQTLRSAARTTVVQLSESPDTFPTLDFLRSVASGDGPRAWPEHVADAGRSVRIETGEAHAMLAIIGFWEELSALVRKELMDAESVLETLRPAWEFWRGKLIAPLVDTADLPADEARPLEGIIRDVSTLLG